MAGAALHIQLFRTGAQPIRAELFSVERLEQHAKSLAEAQPVGRGVRARKSLRRRLNENAKRLIADFRVLANAAKSGRQITSAGEWFLDNFYLVEEQIREVQKDLPADYYNELPKLAAGPLAGFPRVYGIAWALIAHTDGAFDLERLERFVRAYQEVDPLKIGELWAIAITLRITLVEDLRRLIEIVVARLKDDERAEAIAKRVLALPGDGKPASSQGSLLPDSSLSATLITRLEQRLRNQNEESDALLQRLESQLQAQGTTSDRLIQEEYQSQAADDVSVRNVINAMRLVSNMDWSEFVEDVGLVDRVLREDPGFGAMDFASRDRYRRAVEKFARRAPLDEVAVAGAALQAARSAVGQSPREADPGHYLIGAGAKSFARSIGYRPSFTQRFWAGAAATGLTGYALCIIATTLVLAAMPMAAEISEGVRSDILTLLAALSVLPATDLAIALVNRAITNRWGPKPLPALALKDGVPDTLRTLLVVPILLVREDQVDEQIARLEVHYLANADARLRFVMLSDWMDSDNESDPSDAHLLDMARDGIRELNERYAKSGPPLFLLLHRKRLWNDAQGKWMGWERKRGKLHELNRLLRGAGDTSFQNIDGVFEQLPQDVRYIITLDADTRLPRGAAKRLIGKMAHPLNLAYFDPAKGRVTHGHGILQPRVTPSLPVGSESSLFQWAFSGPNGLDPYAFAVSDVYQDLFEEGSFVGKGIYDVDIFERALHQRIPENTVLSHDLLEGVFTRAALASDIELVEEFPSRYDVELARQHRWVRGDWQLLPWILKFGGRGHAVPALGRWKMLDNLRRSLSAPALLLALLIGWRQPPEAAMIWTAFLATTIALPPLLPILAGLLPKHKGFSWRGHARNLARDSILSGTQFLFNLAFLARIAYLSLDAILRTVFRLFISGKNLLEWVSFAQSAYSRRGTWQSLAFQLTGSIAFSLFVGGSIAMDVTSNLFLATPFLTLWALSPLIARWASQAPRVEAHLDISEADTKALRLAARQTWSFFQKFVTAEENHLPPDNFQENPKGEVAHRTSPTNIGLYLNVVLAARDFGWIGTLETVERIEATLNTLQKLESYRGHLLNWYDTQSLRSLDPRYVSTVDSGNLAGSLLVMKRAFAEFLAPVDRKHVIAGLCDTLAMVKDILASTKQQQPENSLVGDALSRLENTLKDSDPDAPLPLEKLEQQMQAMVAHAQSIAAPALRDGIDALLHCVLSHRRDVHPDAAGPALTGQQIKLASLAELCGTLAERMEFGFLFDESRQLLVIGYRVDDQVRDANAYDLLASEARLASFFAIAKGDVPTRHWFHLGRTLTPLGRSQALQSWSGSMFEYLMPSLIMHEPTGSLLALSNRAAVRRQIDYATRLNIPWGISESQYYALDREQNYQYSGFGVPDLGIKRGLSENTVIAPYASGLAAMVAPASARRNLDRLSAIGARGPYGWYEAVDYTRARLPEGANDVVIQTYMAHHQAMMILGIANVVQDGTMRERFHAEPMVQAAELLLQERMPRNVAVARLPPEMQTGAITFFDKTPRVPRSFPSPHTAIPRTHLLSNGNYSLMVTAAGGGYSRWKGMAITRWQEDTTRDNWGSFIYLRDLRNGKVWSAGYQPTGEDAEQYEAVFSEDRATIRRTDGVLSTLLEILVSPEDNSEVRRISITNGGSRLREIEVTSYAELALAQPRDDDAHLTFSKLFVETEYLRETGALLATRRPRSPSEPPIWAAHLSVAEDGSVGDVQYETDRGKFLTRGHNARSAAAIFEGWPLSNSAGAVLDPVFALRRRIQIPRGQTVTIAFWTMAAASREEIMDLVDRHHDAAAFERATTLAATHAQTQLQYLGIGGDDAHLFQLLANYLIYSDARLRAAPEVLERGGRPAAMLWGAGISGDLPIALVRIEEEDELPFVMQMVRAHEYWRQKRLAVDLVILNERASSYAQDLQKSLEATVHTLQAGGEDAAQGKVFLLRTDLLGSEGRDALRAAARIDLSARRGSLVEQLNTLAGTDKDVKTPKHNPPAATASRLPPPFDTGKLQVYNGFGGFSADGREYVTVLDGGQKTPAPWINVIANENFGFQVSAEGAGFCWAINSQQNQITAASNDPVSNEPCEVLYLKDLETGEIWCPTAGPVTDTNGRYLARHGQGYSTFQYQGRELDITLTQFVPLNDPLKISRLKIRNLSDRPRRLALVNYVEWTLGPTRNAGAAYIVTELDLQTRALFARNPHSGDFGNRIGFMDMSGLQTSWTGDRREFLGRNGAHDAPAALLDDEPLSLRLGGGLDPCGVQRAEFVLRPGEEMKVCLLLGQAQDRGGASALIAKYRAADPEKTLSDVVAFWDKTLGTIEIRTPDRSMDLLTNRWLLYQTLSCRFWGRAGFYQASGAYGFRDQLQDSMALCVSHPDKVREHLLRAAGRQFAEGDVQHWWLPESGKGIRTRISDDKSWLGYVASHYIETTGDTGVLEEMLPFLQGPLLHDGEADNFFMPDISQESGTLYEHCARALDASLAVGSHGLPLMGTGDWNDGMNRVGEQGKGESVWLGWFLHETLSRFIKYAEQRRDAARVARWLLHMTALKQALEDTGWDGAWYRRAFFDDGFALGSASNRECRIDSIAQSWAVISGVAAPERAERAMEAVDKYLVRSEDRLLTLFSPPFVSATHDPGYIKGYPAGIRENGGQYTHGVLWSIVAFAMLGNGNRAGELFAMLNPVNHANSRTSAQRYRVEPYVACGDVYSMAPNVGRGGWTWYSGSAAWMYRVAVEYILGIRLMGDALSIDPVIPGAWPKFEVTFRHGEATYQILVENPEGRQKGVSAITLDGVAQAPHAYIPLTRDAGVHQVNVTLGKQKKD